MKTLKLRTFGVVVILGAAIGLLAGASFFWHIRRAVAESQEKTSEQTTDSGKKQVPVVLTRSKTMTFERRITVSGNIAAKRYALVSARIPGTLDAIYVDEGDRVEKGKTKLFQTDALKLTKAVAIAEHNLTVAECSVQEKLALLEKDIAAQNQARNEVKRYGHLHQRNAVAAQVLEQQEARCKQCEADVKHSQALVQLSKAQLQQAQLNLTIAEKDLADSLVMAPISGRVSRRLKEPGEMAEAGTPVLRIEDLSLLEVSVFLPEEAYAEVIPGKTKMRLRVANFELEEKVVSYKSPTVDRKFRTFEVQCLVESPPEGVVPGCLAEATVILDRREGVGVPSPSVQIRGNQEVVFVVDGKEARRVPVKIGREMDGWREILEGLSAGTPVISMGQFLVEQGTPVSVVQEDAS